MIKKAIIGIGSPFGDDSIGWRVMEQLRKASSQPGTDLLDCDRPGPQLLNLMQDYREVILIDAMQSGAPPASLREIKLDEIAGQAALSSHAMGLAETLLLGKTLDMLPETLRIIGIEADRRSIRASSPDQPSMDANPVVDTLGKLLKNP